MIKKNLSRSGRQIRFVSSLATFREVQIRLTSGCQMLHFTGHGRDEYLGFEASEARHCGVLEPLTVRIMDNPKIRERCAAFQISRATMSEHISIVLDSASVDVVHAPPFCDAVRLWNKTPRGFRGVCLKRYGELKFYQVNVF